MEEKNINVGNAKKLGVLCSGVEFLGSLDSARIHRGGTGAMQEWRRL